MNAPDTLPPKPGSEATDKRLMSAVRRVVRHPAYVLTVIFVVMPINGAIMERGQVWLGLVLMAMQLPWAIQRVCELCDKDA